MPLQDFSLRFNTWVFHKTRAFLLQQVYNLETDSFKRRSASSKTRVYERLFFDISFPLPPNITLHTKLKLQKKHSQPCLLRLYTFYHFRSTIWAE
ncbi:hypothetical protein CW304_06285 [Bacillus sp. UFRGS-B20]|nr:hypothetical protein CW304_06285 [Bacillus sp. UFRGS-B20]